MIDNDADNLYITVTARALNPNVKIITRTGQQRYPNAIRNSGADEVIIPEYEGGLMTGRMIQTEILPGEDQPAMNSPRGSAGSQTEV